MHKNMTIFVGTGVIVILLVLGIWFFYYSDRDEAPQVSEKAEETYAIDFTAREGVLEEHVSELEPEEDMSEDDHPESGEEVLREGFINNLAEMIFLNYFPSQSQANSASFMLSFKMVNMHFATDLSDFRVDDQNILEARKEVISNLLQPPVISTVTQLYGPKLIDNIVDLAENRERSIPGAQGSEDRLLTRVETADLLRLFSQRISYLAYVFERSVTDDKVLDLIEDYLQTVDDLRDVYFEYWQLNDDHQSQESERLGRAIQNLIRQREAIRDEILSGVATTDMREAGHDYIYEAQWVYRRIRVDEFSRDSILSLAEAGKAVSVMALDRAEIVLEERTEDREQTRDDS